MPSPRAAEHDVVAGGSEAGISARLRDLRKEKFGGYSIERKRSDEGLWWYRMERKGELF